MPSQRNHRSKTKTCITKKYGEHFFVGWWILKESFENSVGFLVRPFFYPGSWVEKLTKDSRFPPPGATTILRKRHSKGTTGEMGGKLLETVRRCDGIMTGRYRYESSMGVLGEIVVQLLKAKKRYPQVETQTKWEFWVDDVPLFPKVG